MNIKKLPHSFFICALFSLTGFSQSNLQHKIYQSYDSMVGLYNTGLYNGTEFDDPFLNTNGTYRYFKNYDFTNGSINYKGQVYVNVPLKYDLLEDNIITYSNDNLSIFYIKLIPEFIDSFSIYGHSFIKLSDIKLGIAGNSFYEVAYLGNKLNLYIKHTKKKKDKALRSGVQYSFSQDDFYIIKHNGKYTTVNSSKEFRKLFPDKAKEIREFYKRFKTLSKSNPNVFMVKLVKFLDSPKTEKIQK